MATAFARITEEHDVYSFQLTPCAQALYRWLLRRVPAGKRQEIELKDFASFTGYGRKRPYCLRHIWRSLKELIDLKLVEVVKEYSWRIWKVAAHHPTVTKPSRSGTETSPGVMEKSQIQPSNSDSSVHTVEIFKEQQTVPTLHPVNRIDRGSQLNGSNHLLSDRVEPGSTAQPQQPEVEQPQAKQPQPAAIPALAEGTDAAAAIPPERKELIQEIETAGIRLNPQIRALVTGIGLETVQSAISAVKQRLEAGTVKNPPGMLVQALRQGWRPTKAQVKPVKSEPDAPLIAPEGFNEWFKLAQLIGLARAAMLNDDGQQMVLTRDGWEVWEEFAIVFSIRELREMADKAKPHGVV